WEIFKKTVARARRSASELRAGGAFRALPRHTLRPFGAVMAVGLQPLSAGATTKPTMVGEGVISTPQDEFGGSLSPDGKTIYFDRSVPAHYLYTMWESHLVGDKWQKPELMP